MANICENYFYATSQNPENIKYIYSFFDEEMDTILDQDSDIIEGYFDSKWTFPEEKMDELLKGIPDKKDIYMRCLSVEYGCMYHALWECEGDTWVEV
jgi:hypothetical protein